MPKGGFVFEASFWKEEGVEAPVMLRNQGFLQQERDRDGYKSLLLKLKGWLAAAGVTQEMIEREKKNFGEYPYSHTI